MKQSCEERAELTKLTASAMLVLSGEAGEALAAGILKILAE